MKLDKPGHPAHGQLMTYNGTTDSGKALCHNRWYQACVEPRELEPYGNGIMNEQTPADPRQPNQRPQWGRRILPQDQEQTLSGIEDKRQQANATFGRLRQKLADRPELHQRLADLGAKQDQATQLLGKLRYSMEYRYELKRMALTPDRVKSLMPSRDTPWGQVPLFVVGVVDHEGKQHLFQRPIRVQR